MDIDGKKVASEIQERLKEELLQHRTAPSLTFILVGDHPASQTYVKMKQLTCKKVGIHSRVIELAQNTSQSDLLKHIHQLNIDPTVHGILVQLPLPAQIDERAILYAIDPRKDVDGFHPINIGKAQLLDSTAFIPCTPLGIMKLLEAYQIKPSGKRVTIIGRSNLVGRPLANLLSQKGPHANATVTLAHSQTQNLKELCLESEIIVVALGQPKFLKKEMVRAGTIVIDVGINRVDGKIVGDVDYQEVSPLCSYITPVPGGVGPTTIATLLLNTYQAFKLTL